MVILKHLFEVNKSAIRSASKCKVSDFRFGNAEVCFGKIGAGFAVPTTIGTARPLARLCRQQNFEMNKGILSDG